jgi:hypothetical protein
VLTELPAALAAFAAYSQFIIYKAVPSVSRPGKTDKFPVDWRTGAVVSAHDPSYWLPVERAISIAAQWGEPYGVGFTFTEQDPFWFLDADNALTESGWSSESQGLARLLNGCALEVSRSGVGLHYFGTGVVPPHSCRNDALGLEFYHTGRFVALTGISAVGNAATDCSSALPALVACYFPGDSNTAISQEWTSSPVAEWSGITDDQKLIEAALRSRSAASAFGPRACFADLWFANDTVLGPAYPDPVRPYDCSAADAALAQHLAFWTGKDCERIRRLMMGSRLVRDKWEREDYLPRTILGAVARQNDVFQAAGSAVGSTVPEANQVVPTAEGIAFEEVNRFLTPDAQMELFKGCVYITDSHRVLKPGGHILKPDQFRVHYGSYNFRMDCQNERSSRDAFEAFTQSQVIRYPKVNGTCFRPELESAAIVERNGQTFVNSYFPVDIPRKEGDPTPFLAHLAKVLPNPTDQLILLSYMAACVQHKGFKFQWAPLLQGVEGNGKTLFTRCVAEAIGRRYTHWPKASKLAQQFNAWMVGKLFFAVEDIYVPDARREIIEELKPMITGGDGLEIEAKGVDQTSGDICGNFMFNSNHKDAIKKTANDRRFCVLFAAQQEVSHLERDGMCGDYFPELYRWLRNDGYAIVAEYLHTLPIPVEFNPAKDCQRAPVSSTTADAIAASTGSIEQEVMECVEQGLQGFSGGWISSIYFDRLLEEINLKRKVSHSRRRDILESLGYRWHPALKQGRCNNVVLPDGGKPRLYVHDSSLARQITNGPEAEKSYQTANTGRPVPAAASFGRAHQ